MIDFKALAAPFSPASVSWRVGSTTQDKSKGMALAYLDARDVMDRLDEVCGPGGWQCRYSHVGAITVCEIGILDSDAWNWKADGAGQSDIEAEKGALSDAFKRAAVRWGIGRYLYSLPSPWVELETRGRTSVIKESEYRKLTQVLQAASANFRAGMTHDLGADAKKDGLTTGAQSQYEIEKRKAAEKYVADALATFGTIAGGPAVSDWYNTPISPKGRSTNRDAVERMKTTFPDLAQRVETAADEVRLRNGGRMPSNTLMAG